MSALFARKLHFLVKQYLYSKKKCESCVRDCLVLFSVFTDYASGIRLPDCSKLALHLKKLQRSYNLSKWRHGQTFLKSFVSLVNFNYWSKFHVIIITDSGVMTIRHKFFIRTQINWHLFTNLQVLYYLLNPSRPNPGWRGKIRLIFFFHTFSWCLKSFYEGPEGFDKNFWSTTKKCENKNLTYVLF